MEILKSDIISGIRKLFNRDSPAFPSRISLIACLALALGGITLGITENSLAVKTNGFISAIEIINSLLFLAAVNQSVRSPDMLYNYGYGKYESLAVLVSAVLLTVILVATLIEAIEGFAAPRAVHNYYLLIGFSTLSFLIISKMYRYQHAAANKFNMPILRFDTDSWRIDSYAEIGVLVNLIAGFVMGKFSLEHEAKIIDSIAAIILILYSLKVPLTHGKKALDQILDRTLPEYIQIDIIAAIAENIERICEFKSVHTRRSGKDIFIEIDVVMPFDQTIEESYKLEKDIQSALTSKHPTSVTRLYVTPCAGDCIHNEKNNCPVKKAQKQINPEK